MLFILFVLFSQIFFIFLLSFFPLSVTLPIITLPLLNETDASTFFSSYFFFPVFISPYYRYPFLSCCSNEVCRSSFCFIIKLFETFKSSVTFVFFWISCLILWLSSVKSFSPQYTFHYMSSSSKTPFLRLHTFIT